MPQRRLKRALLLLAATMSMESCRAYCVSRFALSQSIKTTSSLSRSLFQQRQLLSSLNLAAEEEAKPENGATNPESPSETSAVSSTTKKNSSAKEANDGSLTRTFLLAVPLFFKFVIVLIIKFLTDLVVFPLLFLYRFLRLAFQSITGTRKGKKNDAVNDA